jgi:predicted regulator of Ras-like GTPase activity (Roadblock/LC7/MglB family)
MSELDEALSRLHRHEGVRHILLLGRDGLLVRHLGGPTAIEVETVAAMVPALATSSAAVGRATELGDFATAVVELSEGVAIVVALSGDLLLALILDPSVGFAPLLREVRHERDQLASLL